jgi:hypothetical protein
MKVLGWVLVILGIPVAVVAARWRALVLVDPRLTAAFVLAWLVVGAIAAVIRRIAAKPVDQRFEVPPRDRTPEFHAARAVGGR